ncbi:MAG: RraA family protein [Planctomycetaceae bacterium]|nr:RraA family protein [Planctomycetaceae bacterium]
MSNLGCRIVSDFSRPDAALVESFRGLPVANIDDCMNRLFALDAAIKPIGRPEVLGPAFTIRVPESDNLMFHKAMDMAKPGDVIVIAAGGSTVRAIFGELMVSYLVVRRIGGIIVDGAIRDADAIAAMPIPVYARGVTPNGPFKNGPGEINTPVACGGQVVNPGDIVVGDTDGVVVVPQHEAAALVEKVKKVSAMEKGIMDGIAQGSYVRPWVDAKLQEIGCTMD